MTKEERKLFNLSLDYAYCRMNPIYLKYVDLEDCYKSYSGAKYRADKLNRWAFDEKVEELKSKTDKPIHSIHLILSHNCSFFTTFQIAYFAKNENVVYVVFRYDTPNRTIEKCFESDRYFRIISEYKSISGMFNESDYLKEGSSPVHMFNFAQLKKY